MITPKEIEILIKNDWEIVSENPLIFERCAQFAGGCHSMETEEDFREELKAIEITDKAKEMRKNSKSSREKDDEEFKRRVQDLFKGLSEETLFQFYSVSCWYAVKYDTKVTSEELRKVFREIIKQNKGETK
jgi:hypothetical protein